MESKKLRMVKFNSKSKKRIKKLSLEIEELRNDNALKNEKLKEMEKEIEWSREELKTLELVAKREVELETEVSRMQHDFVDEQRRRGEQGSE